MIRPVRRLAAAILVAAIAATAVWAGGAQETGSAQKMTVGTGQQVKNLYFWHAFSDEPRSNWINERVAEWNKAHVGYVMHAERKGSYRETLQAAVLAARQGDAPDAVQLFEVGSQIAVDSRIFVPVGDIGTFDTSDYTKPVINYYTIGGTVNSIPFNSSSPILYVNKNLMKQAGLDPNKAPTTFGEVIADLEAARKAGVDAAKISFCLHSWYFEQWMAEQGAPIANNDNGRSGRATETELTSEPAVRIFDWLKQLNDKGFYTYTGKFEDWDGSQAIFQQGKAMFFISSTADLGNVSAAVKGKFALGTGMLPIPDGTKRNGVVIGGASIWILKDHPKPELTATRDFLLYMTNPENMVSWHKLTGYYPVRNSSVDMLRKSGWFTSHPNWEVAFTQLLQTIPSPATAGALMGSFLDTRTIVEQAWQKVLNGATVESALQEAKKLADTKLTEYNSNL